MAWEEDVRLSLLGVIRFNLFYFLWLASDVELFLFVYLQLVCEYLCGPNFMFWLWLLVWILIVIEFLFLISQSILLVGYSYKPSLKIGWSGCANRLQHFLSSYFNRRRLIGNLQLIRHRLKLFLSKENCSWRNLLFTSVSWILNPNASSSNHGTAYQL